MKTVNYRVVGFFMATLLFSCTDDLSHKHAARLIEEHLRSIAPDVLYPFTVGIEIKDVLQSDEHSREVRFHAIFLPNPQAVQSIKPRPLFPRPNKLSAFFQRSDRGWTLARYGEPMKNMVARLWHFQIRSLYLRLLEAISSLGKEATRWESEKIEKLRSRQPNAWAEYLSGISEGELIRRVMMNDVNIPVGVQWGVTSAPNSRFYSILWTRFLSDPAVICVRRIGSRAEDRNPPIEFNWLGKSARLMCKGRKVIFNPYTATGEGLELIDKSDGLLRPFTKN